MASRAADPVRPDAIDSPMISKGAMVLLCSMVFIASLGYGAGLPLIRLYLVRYLGAAAPASSVSWHVGMLSGVYLISLFIFAPLWGRLSDKYGRRLILMSGFATFLIGSAIAALAPNVGFVYGARFIAGAGAAAIVPTAQAYIADRSTTSDRSRRFVLLGSASFLGFLVGPAFGNWLAGPIMAMVVGKMGNMLNWPPLAVALVGLPLFLFIPRCLRNNQIAALKEAVGPNASRQRFVNASMLLAFVASFAVGTFEVGFNLFGSQTLYLATGTMAAMFIVCSVAMLGAQSILLFSAVRRRVDERWLAGAFAVAALALALASWVPGPGALGLMIAVVGTTAGLVGPVLSYELLERQSASPGAMLGQQAAAGNLGQALGSMSAGSLFAIAPTAPFWAAGVILGLGAAVSLAWWGPARRHELTAQSLPIE